MAHHFGLFVNFLGHEVIVAGLVHQRGGGGGDLDLAVGGTAGEIKNRNLGAADHHNITFFQIGDAVGERRQRKRIRPDISFGLGMAHRQRRALARADQQAFMVLEDHGDGIGAGQPRHRLLGGLVRQQPLFQVSSHQMGGHFAVGFRFERVAFGLQFGLEFAKILDDAIVHDRDAPCGVRMGIALGRRAMGSPAGVANAGVTGQRLVVQNRAQIVQLAGRTAARNLTVLQRGDAGRIVTAIFQPLQRFQDDRSHITRARNTDDTAHAF